MRREERFQVTYLSFHLKKTINKGRHEQKVGNIKGNSRNNKIENVKIIETSSFQFCM